MLTGVVSSSFCHSTSGLPFFGSDIGTKYEIRTSKSIKSIFSLHNHLNSCLVGHGPGITSDNLTLSMGYFKEIIIFLKPLELGV